MALRTGSAAVVELAQTMPKSAVAACVSRCADRFLHAAQLATMAAAGPEPVCGAEYLLDTLDDLSAELRFLRAVIRSRAS
ncbi:hypothetical protein [Anaeromyxobacter oryzisoli]|uniref:hypothetical protein n=1 Tax=Anaeromyxobacter oryzisoli TaxID=2925408 RepID=UPI001F56BA24|nr:hypothetical protein [Anaeromyxobacter sp. SG63]